MNTLDNAMCMCYDSSMNTKIDLSTPKRHAEELQRRRISWVEIADKAGVHRNTLYRVRDGKPADIDTLGKIAHAFRMLGLHTAVIDLIVEES